MLKGLKILAVIPARSGSKGLVGKNIRDLMGKPLIAWTIEAALNSEVFDEVIVSTDSQEYANIAKKYGASVPFLRSEETSSDEATSWSVVKEVLNKNKTKFDLVVILQPTSPLRTAQNIKESFDLFFEKNADFVVSVNKFSHSAAWINTIDEDLSLNRFIKEEYLNKRRQDFGQQYILNGAIYITKIKLIDDNINMFTDKSFAYIMDESVSIDIDNELDFEMAKILMKKNNTK